MVRLSLALVVLLLAGCASSPGRPVMEWQQLQSETSLGPGDAWIDAHPTDSHMRCFPFDCR